MRRASSGAWGAMDRQRGERGNDAAWALPRSKRSSPLAPVRERLERDDCGEQQALVLVLRELDSVRVPDAEPTLRDSGDRLAVALDLVLVIDDVPLRLQIIATLDVDREAVTDADERLVHRRDLLTIALDRHLVAHAQLALLDLGHFPAGRILQQDRLAEPHRLAVDTIGAVTGFILDPEVVADRDELLAHAETTSSGLVVSSSQQAHPSPSRAWRQHPPHARRQTSPKECDSAQVGGSTYRTTVPARKSGRPRRRSVKRTGRKPANTGTIARTSPTARTIDRPIEGASPAGPSTRSRSSRISGVWPAALQKRTKYVPAISAQPEAIRAPTSQAGRRPPTSDATSETIPVAAMNRTVTRAASVASASARVAIPAWIGRSVRARRPTSCSALSSSRGAEARTLPTTSSASPVVCRATASRSSGLDATWRSARCVSSLASTLSVSSSVRGLASAAVASRSSSPLAASSATTRSSTRCRTSERANSSGRSPASARSTTRAISGEDRTSSAASSSRPRQACAAARAGKKAARPAAAASPERCSSASDAVTRPRAVPETRSARRQVRPPRRCRRRGSGQAVAPPPAASERGSKPASLRRRPPRSPLCRPSRRRPGTTLSRPR